MEATGTGARSRKNDKLLFVYIIIFVEASSCLGACTAAPQIYHTKMLFYSPRRSFKTQSRVAVEEKRFVSQNCKRFQHLWRLENLIKIKAI